MKIDDLSKKIIFVLMLFLLFMPLAFSTQIKVCSHCRHWISCETDSMNPTLNCTSTLYIEPIKDIKDVKFNDIVWYHPKDDSKFSQYKNHNVKWIVHRIVGRTKEGWVLKGDNNHFADDEIVKDAQIKYKVVKIIN